MILRFSVSDFRSFGEEETLSLLAGTRVSDHQSHLVAVDGVGANILRTAVIYGANGAGKSNLYHAMKFLHDLATSDISKDGHILYPQFAFGTLEKKGTMLRVLFAACGGVYSYEVGLQDGLVVHERSAKYVAESLEVLFERTYDKSTDETSVSIGRKFVDLMPEKVRALAVVGVPKTRTFLSNISENIQPAHRGEDFAAIMEWFEQLIFIAPNAEFGGNLVDEYSKTEFHDFAKTVLEAAAGVSDLRIDSYDMDESGVRQMMSKDNVDASLDVLHHNLPVLVNSPSGHRAMIVRNAENLYRMDVLRAVHRLEGGHEGILGVGDESDGTKRMLDLLPAFFAVKTHARVCIVDEMDRSIHSLLMRSFLRMFLDGEGKGQLIFTTHENSLLDVDIFRRDEIWFAEKDTKGMTRLYSLNDYRPRTLRTVRDYYLQGRYGAIPSEFGFGSVAHASNSEESPR